MYLGQFNFNPLKLNIRLMKLSTLCQSGNFVLQEQTDYWLLAIFMLLQLTELDLKKISVEEKVCNHIILEFF